MTQHRLELADVIRSCGSTFLDQFGDSLSSEQRRALDDLVRCRSAALGGHVEMCDQCGHQRIAYNSCRNRHCPKCQGPAAAQWLDARASELLPVEYFHVVFTLPDVIGPIALQNPQVVYGVLLRAAAETLLQIAADPSTSVPRSASWPSSIRGDKICSTIPTSTVLFPVAGCRRMARVGSPAVRGSFCPCAS
jgi:hypothetical protein